MLHPVSPSSAKVRSRRGCLTCRLRKVKCDENAGRCQNCTRLSLECSWPTITSFKDRKKYRKACERCRRKKLKCGLTDGVQQCDPCTLAKTECIKSDTIERLQQSPSPPKGSDSSQSHTLFGLPSRPEVSRILQAYFDGPHYFCFYTFIHPPTFMQMLDNDLIPRCLLLIVLATGLHCLDPDSALPDSWAEECRRLVIPDIFSRPSTTNLQTLLLLQRYEWHRGAHLSAYFVAALATRLATALQLEAEPSSNRSNGPPLPVTVMETRRRLIWSCFTMDSVPDGSTRPLRSALDPFSIEARLPCDERSYWLGLDTLTNTFSDIKESTTFPHRGRSSSSSIAGCIIQMAVIRLQVLQYASTFAPKKKELLLPEIPWQLDSKFYYHKLLLDDFLVGLSPEFQWNEYANLDPSSWQSTRSTLCTLHVMYHAAYTDLLRVALFLERAKIVLQNKPSCEDNGSCRQSMAGFHQSTEFRTFLQFCRRSRLQHAYDITTIIASSLFANLTYQDLDPFVSVGACVSIRVLTLERGPGDAESLGISDAAIQSALDVATTCAKRTARWSQPMRKMLHALVERALQCGFRLDVPEIMLPRAASPTSHLPSRAQSPSLRTYGTQGSIHRSLESHKDDTQVFLDQQSHVSTDAMDDSEKGNNIQESTLATTMPHSNQDPSIPIASFSTLESTTTGIAGTTFPNTGNSGEQSLHSPFLHSYEALSPESLRIASNWINGTYDIVSSDLSFDMGLGDTLLDFNGGDYQLFSTEIENDNIWPAL